MRPVDGQLTDDEPRDPFDGRGPFKKWASWLKEPGELQSSVARAVGKAFVAGVRARTLQLDYVEEHLVVTVPKALVERYLGRKIP